MEVILTVTVLPREYLMLYWEQTTHLKTMPPRRCQERALQNLKQYASYLIKRTDISCFKRSSSNFRSLDSNKKPVWWHSEVRWSNRSSTTSRGVTKIDSWPLTTCQSRFLSTTLKSVSTSRTGRGDVGSSTCLSRDLPPNNFPTINQTLNTYRLH